MTLGQLAYETYGNERGWKIHGMDMQSWDQLKPTVQTYWHAVADAVAHQVKHS